MADLKEMGTHLMQYRKAIALSNQNYADIRKIQEELQEELGIKLSINQTVTLIIKYYVSNNRN